MLSLLSRAYLEGRHVIFLQKSSLCVYCRGKHSRRWRLKFLRIWGHVGWSLVTDIYLLSATLTMEATSPYGTLLVTNRYGVIAQKKSVFRFVLVFFTSCPLAKMFLGKQTVTRFINKCVYFMDLGKWLSSQQPTTGRCSVNPFSYPYVNRTLKSNFHPVCFISILRSRPRILSQIIFCIFTLTPRALQVQSTLSSLIW